MFKRIASLLSVLGLLAVGLLPCTALGQSSPPDPWAALKFLEGTWEARATAPAGVKSDGAYTFVRELNGHVMARHSTSSAGCKGPVTFDCQHSDELTIYQDAPGEPLRAIYFDNEGHTLHYTVSTPAPGSAIFLSEPGYGPQVRLVYELKDGMMSGKFQILPPGAAEWKSYLEWSGARRP